MVAVGGNGILALFGVDVEDFRVAGGLVLLLIALDMLNGRSRAHHGTTDERAEQEEVGNVAFYPLTFPMIVGPGTITTLVLFASRSRGLADDAAIAVVLAVVLGTLALVLYFGSAIGRVMSKSLRAIVSRLMAMILAAIAVEMIVAGLLVLLPGLAGR
ncbi:MAG: MarC family protein [Myxococcota bacterium]